MSRKKETLSSAVGLMMVEAGVQPSEFLKMTNDEFLFFYSSVAKYLKLRSQTKAKNNGK